MSTTLSRRGFLKLLGPSAVAVAAQPALAPALKWFPADDDAEVTLSPAQERGLAAVLQEIYSSEIKDLVYKENPFLKAAMRGRR